MKRTIAFSLIPVSMALTACGGSGSPSGGDGSEATTASVSVATGGPVSGVGGQPAVGGTSRTSTGAAVSTGNAAGTTGPMGTTGQMGTTGDAATGAAGGAGGVTDTTGGGMAGPCSSSCVAACGPEDGTAAIGQCEDGLVCCTPSSGPDDIVYDYGAPVEDTGTACEVPELPEPAAIAKNSKLPDPFMSLGGGVISKKSDWRCRRKEIRAQAEKYVYGERPAPPELVDGSVSEAELTVHVEDMGSSIDFAAGITLPSTGSAPYPAVIYLGSFGGIPRDIFLNEGVAVITYDNGEIGTEHQPEGNLKQGDVRNQPKQGKFYDIYGGLHSAGLLMAWSWGASRLIDVLQNTDQDLIAWDRLGVTGCSRLGKGAFAIGLFDERIALTIPHETSTGGVPAYRIADALPTEDTNGNYWGQLWFSNNFEPFVLNTTQLPLDTHAFIAAIAPRGLMILENPHVAQMGAPAGHMAALAASKVWESLGVLENLSYFSDIPSSQHCAYSDAYTPLLVQNIQRFLKHESEEPGRIQAGTELDPADWIDWQAPILSDE